MVRVTAAVCSLQNVQFWEERAKDQGIYFFSKQKVIHPLGMGGIS